MSTGERYLWLNGQVILLREAMISPLDRGLQVGHGAFETMHAKGGKVIAITRHWQRLCNSCEVLGLIAPCKADFFDAILQTLSANGAIDARVRFTVTGGSMMPEERGTMLVTLGNAPNFEATERVATVSWPRNERSPLASVKSLSYGDNVLAIRHAKEKGAGEAIFPNSRGEICEGAASNIFLVQDETEVLITPPLEAGCLPGVMRGLVVELAEANGIVVLQQALPISALTRAREVFLTSSTRYVQAVSHVNGQVIPHAPGRLTMRLSKLLEQNLTSNPDP